MTIEKHNTVIVIIALTTVIILITTVVSSFWPEYEIQFIEFGLLGENKIADDYFASENSTVALGSQVKWYIYLHNHMGSPQEVIVRVKLLNSTMAIPIDQENEPAPYPSYTELQLSLFNNETSLVPFTWSVVNLISRDDSIVITSLMANDVNVETNVSTLSTSFFRMVFELWVYDISSGEYRFGWNSSEGFDSSSLHIGFKVTQSLA